MLVNESSKGFFISNRGLRQGDPLSPYLFVIEMEVFFMLIDKATSKGFLSGYTIANRNSEGLKVTHMMFATDTLVFCRDSREHMAHLS